ncbi:hypothetical protein EZS27_028643, partial [termite gut metagenome]
MPDMRLIEMWADEYLSLLKKYRNHPSILFWTVNNEMKFYDNDPEFRSIYDVPRPFKFSHEKPGKHKGT